MTKTFIDYFKSPQGLMRIVANKTNLLECLFVSKKSKNINPNKITNLTKKYLANYFNGLERPFPKNLIKFDTQNFNEQIYKYIFEEVPVGKTTTYKKIGEAINSKAYRTIGSILGKNKIVIIIPCHRVIKSNNYLGHYTFSGKLNFDSHIKSNLINHEKAIFFNKNFKEYIYFNKNEVNQLKSHPKLKLFFQDYKIIDKVLVYKDPFWALLSRVIYQQISNKTAKKLEIKLLNYLNWNASPRTLMSLKDNIYARMGFSQLKIMYIKNICDFVINNESIWKQIIKSKDENFIESHLLKTKGLGKWSIWTFLLFGLKRKNVIRFDDLILIKALKQIYGHTKASQNDFDNFIKGYESIGSLISINIWNYVNPQH